MPHKDPEARRTYTREAMRRRRAAMRSARNEARRVALLARDIDPVVCAQAAGLFEGEGTATVTRAGRAGYSRCAVMLTSTDREIVDWLQGRWPGAVIAGRRRRAAHREAWTWRLNGDAALPFLLDISPYLITERKREVCRLVAECQMARWDGQRQPGYRERIEEFHRRVRLLNQRGVPAGSPA